SLTTSKKPSPCSWTNLLSFLDLVGIQLRVELALSVTREPSGNAISFTSPLPVEYMMGSLTENHRTIPIPHSRRITMAAATVKNTDRLNFPGRSGDVISGPCD